MFEVFGPDMPLWLRFIFTLIVLVGLFFGFIGLLWLLRRFGAERFGLGTGGGRSRQVRLAVLEDLEISGRRRLILIRRDNIEHLLMIGGPTDLVVEPNIVRAAAQREASPPPRAPAAAETLPRAVPLGDEGMWPESARPESPRSESPRPEPVRPQQPMPRPRIPVAAAAPAPAADEAEPEEAEAPPPPHSPPPRRQLRAVDPLAGLAAELSRPGESPRAPMAADLGPGAFVPREPARLREAAREREAPIEREGREPMRAEREPMRAEREPMREQEPAFEAPPIRVREPVRERERERERAAPVEREREVAQMPEPAPEPEFDATADQNLADMAQRLEAALRRPARVNEARPPDAASRAMTAELNAAQRAPVVAHPRTAAPAPDAGAPRAEPKPAKSVYDSLEKEMASLLGRPSGKT